MGKSVQPTRHATADQSVEIEFLEGLLRRMPGNPAVLRPLADLYTEVGRFQEGLDLDRFLVAWDPEDGGAWYNLACSQALLGQSEKSLLSLVAAVHAGYDDADWMRKDPDLAPVRNLPAFATLLATLRVERGT